MTGILLFKRLLEVRVAVYCKLMNLRLMINT